MGVGRRDRAGRHSGAASATQRGRRRARAHRQAATRRSMPSPPSRPSARARKAQAVDATRDKVASCRSPACRSRSRTCSTSRACRRVAGSKINRDARRPARDATLIERLEAAGAVLVGALNMGEYAYDFTGENVHDGPSRNPHDITRMTGGSSGGSGGAVGRRPGADRARLRHQRLDPRAVVVLRHVRPEADLWPAVARAHAFRSSRASIISGPFARSARDLALVLRRHAGARCRRSGLRRPRRSNRWRRCWRAASTACASRSPAAISARVHCRRRSRRVDARRQGAGRDARDRDSGSAARARRRLRDHRDRRRGAASRPAAHAGGRFRSRRARPADRRRHGAGRAGDEGAEVPPLVSRARAGAVQERRRHPGAGHALHRAEASARRLSCSTASRCRCGRTSASTRSRSRSSACRWWRCRCRCSRCRSAVQIIAAPWREDIALRIAHALEQMGVAAAPRPPRIPGNEMDIDLPEVVAEVKAAFDTYEKALVTNDVDTLDELFRDDPRTIRYGATEISTAMAKSRPSAPRVRRSALGRTISRTVITTYGREFAVASTLTSGRPRPARSAARCRPG